MCVPFGKILNGLVVPNTVTKTLHIQKFFEPDLSTFTIRENQFYASIDNQVNTIQSFDRPVILVDDLRTGLWTMPLLKEQLIVLPFFFAGMLLGSKLYHRMNQATFVKLTYVLLFISGVILLFK